MSNRVSVYAGGHKISGDWRPLNGVRVYAGGNLMGQDAWVRLTGGATRTFLVRGTNGAKIYVDFGDGSAVTEYTLLGTGTDVPVSHAYSAGTYTMTFSGALDDVTYFSNDLVTQGVQSFNFKEFSILEYLYFNNESGVTSISSIRSLPELHTINFRTAAIPNSELNSILPTLPQLIYLQVNFNSLLTDASFLESLVNLSSYVFLNACSIQTMPDSFPAYDGLILLNFYSNGAGFPTDECIERMADSNMINNTINIAGTNPARTIPDTDADVATIVTTNNNVLTVNE